MEISPLRRTSCPVLDLKAQYASFLGELHAAVVTVLADGNYVSRLDVEAFEAELAAYAGRRP